MFIALDSSENRIYADEYKGETECFCPVCGEKLRFRSGDIRRPHFAHRGNTECLWGLDKDYKSEWHIRMQEYFPKEAREYRFKSPETGEIHIADVFIESKNTVIEFQKSPIQADEYLSRTFFHLKNGRRIVWVFDESTDNQSANRGRFKPDDFLCMEYPHFNLQYKWMYQPRRCLSSRPDLLKFGRLYSICVWIGAEDEGDVLHRIIAADKSFKYVCFSFHDILLSNQLNVEDFFKSEDEWLQDPQHKHIGDMLEKIKAYKAQVAQRKTNNKTLINSTRRGRTRL